MLFDLGQDQDEDSISELFRIPITPWVMQTIQKMNARGNQDIKYWSTYWYKSCTELGGKNKNSGSKECPKHAAFGLWRLGRIEGGGQALQESKLSEIDYRFGKNTTYAVLALEVLEIYADKMSGEGYWSKTKIWRTVKEMYKQRLPDVPAESEQGAVRIALALHRERKIVSLKNNARNIG